MSNQSRVYHIENLKSLQDITNINPYVVIDFSATWCGPCKKIGPVFEELSKQHQNWTFCKVDVDLIPDAAELYKINALPTFVYVKDDKVVNSFEGANVEFLVNGLKSTY